MSAEADVSYSPSRINYALTFSRASSATYVDDVSDLESAYWPGQLALDETFSRASTATYVQETGYPAP